MATVLVTGGNGCLGQHIIKLLQEKMAEEISEIRVLDLQQFEQQLEYESNIPVTSYKGDITDSACLQEVAKGIHSVIHVAAYIDVRLFPDKRRLDLVNRQGTELLLDVCMQNNVEIFLYCSTIDVIQGYTDTVNATEDRVVAPENLLFGEYARTKQAAEKMVLNANNNTLPNGKRLRTAALRPTVLYGELDQHFVTSAVKTGLQNKNIMIDFCGKGKCNVIYAGNAAWSFVCAYKAMKLKPELGGEAFILKDDTTDQSMLSFCKTYFEEFDIVTYRSYVPYWILYVLVVFIQMLLYLLSPFKKVQFPLTLSTLIYTNLIATYDGSKAQRLLGYRPLYSYDDSTRRSIGYYKAAIDSKKKS